MINFKQEELIQDFLDDIKVKFPEVRFINVTESPEDPADLWINVTAPEDEDREDELLAFACNRTVDILEDYGYYLLLMPMQKKAA